MRRAGTLRISVLTQADWSGPLKPTRRVEPVVAGPLLLGVDIGTSRTKAVVVDREGREVGASTVPTPFAVRDDEVEMEVDSLRHCLQSVLAALGDARRQVVGVGLAGMAESGAPFDDERRPLAPIIAWHDPRGHEAAEALDRQFAPDLALRIGQRVRSVLTVSKLGWMIEHGLSGMTRWLGVPEIGLQALTGAEATEFSLVARTGCYDVGRLRWMPEVPEAIGFSTVVFPTIGTAGAVLGRVSAQGAAWSGLPEGIPVTLAGHDHLVGMAGAGVGPAEAANSVGTAETIVARVAVLPDMAIALAERVMVTVHPGGEGWAALAGAARAGLVLETAAEGLGRSVLELDRLAAEAQPVEIGDRIDALARGVPVSFPDAPDGEIWAGLLHALSARTAAAYGRLAKVAGPWERLVVFGGGAASQPWLRAKAAAVPVPVVHSATGSAVARGAALYAGVAAGWWPSPAAAPTPPAMRGV
jgi:xylulokinase